MTRRLTPRERTGAACLGGRAGPARFDFLFETHRPIVTR